MPSCSPCRRRPRGFALMWALVIVATLLGGSALVLQKAALGQDQVKRQKLAAVLDSGVASGQRLARALVLASVRDNPAQLERSVDLEGMTVHVVAQRQDGEPRRYLASVTATKGKATRSAELTLRVVPPPQPAPAGLAVQDLQGTSVGDRTVHPAPEPAPAPPGWQVLPE